MMRNALLVLFKTSWILVLVNGFPECIFEMEIYQEKTKCLNLIRNEQSADKTGCAGIWDNITCWLPAKIGETVTVSCPKVFGGHARKSGSISKNCTRNGWSDVFPHFFSACGPFNETIYDDEAIFYVIVKVVYTLGHSTSLIALTASSTILCLFRKVHCTRNYIHLNLFLSFIFKAIAVLVKDGILYSFYCPVEEHPWVGCKAILVFLQYFVMANFYWLLVEGLYLHTLLVVIFSYKRHFTIYFAIGWGIPMIFIICWILSRVYLENTGCWDTNEQSIPWWVMRTPILCSIIVNFLLFIHIIRILLQKLWSPEVGGKDQSQYKRLAKSTLLLIPLFGIHYIVFTVFPISTSPKYQLIFELCLGSFQGLIVAVLYCFLNSEVQGELKKMWHNMQLNQKKDHDYRLHSISVSRNGSECTSQFHRNSRAQSLLQTETSVM
ncbi:vasoactive intestinal polypeptide receptor 2 [Rhinatrema bivittatum]|uniref:vasoactive intestinal polypeptide receptor 2 n=1 Tax=Rhinatrema bivittatum TaxID=194408 RepID=UPI00112D353C|nr:vasoactive intestinal polypeptide receptor 2 [Rhinatrema bivittatum]